MSDEEDPCDICGSDRSPKKNPIIFCDGEDCNLPVHKKCYRVEEVPSGPWHCDWCEDIKKGKKTHVYCCPSDAGARKRTNIIGDTDEFMHVVCAMWNKNVKHDSDSYAVAKLDVGKEKCYLCKKKQGICIPCEDPSCSKRFHVTCAIKEDILSVGSSVPPRYSAKCGEHKEVKTKEKRSRGKSERRRRVKHSDDEDEDMEEDEDDDEDEDEDDEEDEDEEGEEESEDEDDLSQKADRKTSKHITAVKKRKASAAHSAKSGPIKLFQSDQSDSDDDMGTISRKDSKSTKGQPAATPLPLPKQNANQTRTHPLQDRNDPTIPKQLKTEPAKKLTPPSSAAFTSSLAMDLPKPIHTNNAPKQKPPNRTYLANKKPENSIHRSPITANKDLDEKEHLIGAPPQRRSIPVTPNEYTARSPFGPPIQTSNSNMIKEIVRETIQGMHAQQSMELQSANQHIGQLQVEVRKLQQFKSQVADVFRRLENIQTDRIDEHMQSLHEAICRTPVTDGDHERIAKCVENLIREDK